MPQLDTHIFCHVPPRPDSGHELIEVIVVVTALYDVFLEAISLSLLCRGSNREVVGNGHIDRPARVSIAVIARADCDIPL